MVNITTKKTELANNTKRLETLKSIIQNSIRQNTKRTYQNAYRSFALWCEQNNCKNITTEIVLMFLTDLSKTHKISTVKTYFSALKSLAKEQNITLDKDKFNKFFKGLNNKHPEKRPQGSKALDFEQLKDIVKSIDTSTIKGKRDKAILLLAFYGAFRRSEIANLDLSDLTENNKGFTVLVRNSKTDKDYKGIYKAIPYNFKDPEICPVRAIKDWINTSDITQGALFRTIKKGGKLTQNRISDNDIYRLIKRLAPDFSPHSLRSGFITTASKKGANPQMIMQQTGHKTVQMIAHYTRPANIWQNNAVELL